jgi:hypothetical protein
VVELDPQRTAGVADLDGEVEPLVLLAELVEVAEGLAREVPDLRVVPLRLELRDDDDGDHHRVLGEAEERTRVGQEDGGVEHVRALGLLRPLPPVVASCGAAAAVHRGHGPLHPRAFALGS